MATLALDNRVPRLIAFDLDYTLWNFYIDCHVTCKLGAPLFHSYIYSSGALAPLHRKENTVQDKYGSIIDFYPDVPKILIETSSYEGTKIAVCSRTHAPALARDALSLIHIPLLDGTATAAVNFFDQTEIYPDPKITHFKELHRKTGIPYREMLFYDDERRNSEVQSLGVTFILVERGLDYKTFQDGLAEWRKNLTTTEP